MITEDPNIHGGTPVFAGTDVPFQTLLNYIENGKTLDGFLKDSPRVTREVAIVALDQVKRLAFQRLDRTTSSAPDRTHALSALVDMAALVLKYIEDGKTLDAFLKESPHVTREATTAALEQLKTLAFVPLDRATPKSADRPHLVSVVLSVAALIVSAFSARLSIVTTKITKEKAVPLVYDTEAELRKVYDTEAEVPNKNPLTANSILIAAVQLQNQGETAATEIRTQYNLKFLPKNQHFEPDYAGSECYTERQLAYRDWTRVNFSRPQPLSAEEVDQINKGTLVIYFFGRTSYKGSSERMHYQKWAWYYVPALREFWRYEFEARNEPCEER